MKKPTAWFVIIGYTLVLAFVRFVTGGRLIEWAWTHPKTFVGFWLVVGLIIFSSLHRKK